ncbi:hypothetical protein ACK3GY_003212 [Vibrio parahaemolyticus]
MDKQKLDAEFSAQFNRVGSAMANLGGHSRFLLMNRQRKAKIDHLVKQVLGLKVLSELYDQERLTVEAIAQALTPEKMDELVADNVKQKQSTAATKQVGQEPGFALETLTYPFAVDDIGSPLMAEGQEMELVFNPHEQRVNLKTSDESVIAIEDGKFIVKGAGDATLSATFVKSGNVPGLKSDMTITLTLQEKELPGDIEEAPEGSKARGFLRPTPDFDIELELGKNAFIGTVVELPIAFANPESEEFEFESSDTDVFEVDAQTGAILPKAEGDAVLKLHIGDDSDDVVVSIK